MQPERRPAAPLRRGAQRFREGRHRQALEPAPAIAEPEQLERVEHACQLLPRIAVLEDHPYQSGRTGKVLPPDRMPWILGKRRIKDTVHLRTSLQPARDRERSRLVL